MKYVSTRGEAPELGFEDVLLAGLARDGGLYLPNRWPRLSPETIAAFRGASFAEIAVEVILPFVEGAVSRDELTAMANDAYAGFGSERVAPLVRVTDRISILELFHGPTLAFKDVAMQMLARLMDHVLARRGTRATIVGATSGDTGGAAIEAFRNSTRADIFILFPNGRVSDVQRRMMTTPTESNVHALAIDGTFDDCQALVKAMFNDHAFRDSVHLSGVNSINWARIMAQVTYYFSAAADVANARAKAGGEQADDGLIFAVPTGNFGDIFAGYVARQMGLPIKTMIIASNANDILPRTVDTGVYEMRGVQATSAPSMDIQISSNFERYLFEASGRDSARIRDLMQQLSTHRRFELGQQWAVLKQDFAAVAASEDDVADCIRRVARDHGYLLDPHTACGYVAAERANPTGETIVLATAHPAKFPEAMTAITGKSAALPERLATLLTDPERIVTLDNDLSAVETHIRAVLTANVDRGKSEHDAAMHKPASEAQA